MLLGILSNDQRDESYRLFASEPAGDYTVFNNELADALLSIVLSVEESEDLCKLSALGWVKCLTAQAEKIQVQFINNQLRRSSWYKKDHTGNISIG